MNLQFDSIKELEQFLMFSAHIGRAFAVAPPHAPDAAAEDRPGEVTDEVLPGEYTNANDLIATLRAPATTAQGEDGPLMADGGTPAKRKRRTKAEIEAERAAEGKTVAALAEAAQPDISATTTAASAESVATPGAGNPFAVASPATQAILEAPNQSTAILAGIAAMQTNPPVAGDPVAPRVVESIEHLRACQSFIQAHGMARYNESFRDGLNANITTYTPEQRAQHVGILEAFALGA